MRKLDPRQFIRLASEAAPKINVNTNVSFKMVIIINEEQVYHHVPRSTLVGMMVEKLICKKYSLYYRLLQRM